MNREEFELLIGWHRDAQSRLGRIELMVAVIFTFTVVPTVLKALGIHMWWM